MKNTLLKQYIMMLVAEARNANVPNQLLAPNGNSEEESVDGQEDMEEDDGLKEFSAVGAIAGYTAPLGMSGDALGRKKNKRKS